MSGERAGLDLRTRAIQSTAWLLLLRLGSQLSSWVVTIVIARYLTTADYGLFAMALTVVATVELLREAGLGAAIVQRQDLTDEHLNTIFWIVAAVSTVLLVVLWTAAGAAAAFYDEPRLVWMLRILGVTFVLNVLGFVPYGLLTKAIDFRRRSLATMAGVIASSVVALVLASLGYGVWAMVIGHVTNAAILNGALAIAARWIPGLKLTRENMGEILRFGLRLSAVSVVGSWSPVANRALVGRFLGGSALGLFTMGDALAEAPHKVSSAVIHQLSLPIFARLQRQEAELRRYFLKITKYLALATIPAQVGLAIVADDFIVVCLSAQWISLVPLFQVFCLGNVFRIVALPPYPLLVARGRAKTLLRFNWVAALATAAAIVLGAQVSLLGVGVAWFATFVVLKIGLLRLALREIAVTAGEFIENLKAPLVSAMVMSMALLAIRRLDTADGPGLRRLAIEVTLAAAVYLVSLLLMDRRLLPEMKSIIHDVRTSRA